MQWMITNDLIPTEGLRTRVGMGLYPAKDALPAHPESIAAQKAAAKQYTADWPFEFRLKDDDGEVYYEGRCGDLDNADEEMAFAPLDWAMNDAGCTTMEYRRVGEKEWKQL